MIPESRNGFVSTYFRIPQSYKEEDFPSTFDEPCCNSKHLQCWIPVIALIKQLVARRAVSIDGVLIRLCAIETSATDNPVDVARRSTGFRDRIRSLDREAIAIDCEDVSSRGLGEEWQECCK